MTRDKIDDRNKLIGVWYRSGWPMRKISGKTGLTYRQLYHILHEVGVKLRGWQDKAA